VQFRFRILPGETGVDFTVLGNGSMTTGFKYAEIKPRKVAQQRRLEVQVEHWGYSPNDVKALTYEADGSVFDGF
jgi:hypothetical protein